MKQSKKEQFFLLCMLMMASFGLFMITGCGGNAMECVRCKTNCEDNSHSVGISLPGCGGCLSSGKGCNSCLWAQSVKFVCSNFSYEIPASNNPENRNTKEEQIHLIGCDTQYYDKSYLGCEPTLKSTYSGFYEQNPKSWLIFCGSTDYGNHVLGCMDGSCATCSGKYFDLYNELIVPLEIQLDFT